MLYFIIATITACIISAIIIPNNLNLIASIYSNPRYMALHIATIGTLYLTKFKQTNSKCIPATALVTVIYITYRLINTPFSNVAGINKPSHNL